MAGKAVNLALDEGAGNLTARERFEKFPLMYNVHEPLNLETGASQESVLGVLRLIDQG